MIRFIQELPTKSSEKGNKTRHIHAETTKASQGHSIFAGSLIGKLVCDSGEFVERGRRFNSGLFKEILPVHHMADLCVNRECVQLVFVTEQPASSIINVLQVILLFGFFIQALERNYPTGLDKFRNCHAIQRDDLILSRTAA